MGTSNFYYKDELHVVETENDWDYNDLLLNISALLESMDKKVKSKNKNLSIDVYSEKVAKYFNDNMRSFPARECGQVEIESDFMGINIRLTLNVLIRSGYYEHVNIDYEWSLNAEGNEFDVDASGFDLIDGLNMDYFSINSGMVEMNTKHLDKRLNDMRLLAKEAFTHIGQSLGTQYAKSAQFSNGETWFKKLEQTVASYQMLNYAV